MISVWHRLGSEQDLECGWRSSGLLGIVARDAHLAGDENLLKQAGLHKKQFTFEVHRNLLFNAKPLNEFRLTATCRAENRFFEISLAVPRTFFCYRRFKFNFFLVLRNIVLKSL